MEKVVQRHTSADKRRIVEKRPTHAIATSIIQAMIDGKPCPQIRFTHDTVEPELKVDVSATGEPTLFNFHSIHAKRAEENQKLGATCNQVVDAALKEIEKYKTSIGEWRKKRLEMIQATENEWKNRSDSMADAKASMTAPERERLEREWASMTQSLPSGTIKSMLVSCSMPLHAKTEMASHFCDMDEELRAQIGNQESAEKERQRVHWKLRNAVDEIARTYRTSVEHSASSAIDATTQKVGERAMEEVLKHVVSYNAKDEGLRGQALVLQNELIEKGNMHYMDVLHYWRDLVREQENTLRKQLAMKCSSW
ncbi:MAG: hypothetical protein CMD33_08985 [Flavobacteriales bacterium]|nr:hypothetical protein [Flavobacteriales bacterium]